METKKLYQLLIVDDESFVRQGLSQYVDWEALGYTVAGTADCKETALHFLEENPVDVILTDIRMPDGTGLELLQECRGIQPDVKSVILSGYGEFEYAQKALRLGSFDFLTKPVDFSQLTAIFLKLHDILSQLETQNRNLQEVYRLKKDNFFHNVTKYSVEPETLAQRCREYNLPPCGRYGILRIRYPDAENCLPGLPPDCREAVSRLIGESGAGDRCYVFPNEAHEITVALYDIPKGETAGLLELLKPYLDYHEAIAGVGSFYEGIGKLKEAYQEAGQALEYHHLQTEERIIEYGKASGQIDFGAAYSQNSKESMLDCLSEGRSDLLAEFLVSHIDNLIADGSSIDTIKALAINSILVVEEYLKQNTSCRETGNGIQELICRIISMKSRHRIQDIAREYLASTAPLIESAKSRSPVIDRALVYIREHYSENITLQSLAEDIYLHPVYLSRLFKEKVGQTFLEYLTHYRIEMAKDYLRNPNLRIYDIGQMVGYETPQYFSRVFKELTGKTPKGFREELAGKGEKHEKGV